MKLRNRIHKAVLLIDINGEREKAIELLRASLSENSDENEASDVIAAKVFLGELLFEGKLFDEARRHLQDSIRIFNDSEIEMDLIDTELNRAKELIRQIS